MTVNFPDVGPDRRWNVKEGCRFYEVGSFRFDDDEEAIYILTLEQFTPDFEVDDTKVVHRRNWFGWLVAETVRYNRMEPGYWTGMDSIYVRSLETAELIAAAEKILAAVAKREWEKTRLGTYPPKTLED